MKVETIVARAKRRYTRESLAGTAWEDLVSRAVAEYSRWNPCDATATLETTADQSDYPLEGCLAVRHVFGAQWMTVPGYRELKKTMPSLALIDDINADALAHRTALRWEWRTGSRVLRLFPPGGTVTVEYLAGHEVEEGEYATIPDEDLDIVVDLLLYELYGDRGFEVALEPNYTAGLEREEFGSIQANVALVRAQLLERVQGKYGGTGGVVWP